MKCILMNKNTPIALVEYNTTLHGIETVYDMYNIEYAPLSVYTASKNPAGKVVSSMNRWFRGRGIPSWRKDLEFLLERLNVDTTDELLNKAYGLSLSDQYWIKEETSTVQWSDINFFTNDFKYQGYLIASLDSSNQSSVAPEELHSPNNTTDGMLQKGWIIEDGKRVLVKGTYTINGEEPFNEWLASQICNRLEIDFCNYSVDVLENKLVSKCNDFISEDEEIITAYDILCSEKQPNHLSDYEFYIGILEKHGVPNARKNVANMFFVDSLIMNTDRHLKNFGVIRDVNSLEWVRTTPVFDCGQSMRCDQITENLNFLYGIGKFFKSAAKGYDKILETVYPDISFADIRNLDGLEDEYRNLLLAYQSTTRMPDTRINALVDGLSTRIDLAERYMTNRIPEKGDPELYEVIEANTDKTQKYWDMAFGLQKVDDLSPSEQMKELANQNVDGVISCDEVERSVYQYYDEQDPATVNYGEKEADIVSLRIVQLLKEPAFSFDVSTLLFYHKFLFTGVDLGLSGKYIGQFRDCNISKKEAVLNGASVIYAPYEMISSYLQYDFQEEKAKSYVGISLGKQINQISDFTSKIWQVHPFREGNTRTTAVFIEKYLNSIGFEVDNSLFKEHSAYFRNALVRANYSNVRDGIAADDHFLKDFFFRLLSGKELERGTLNNADLTVSKNRKKDDLEI